MSKNELATTNTETILVGVEADLAEELRQEITTINTCTKRTELLAKLERYARDTVRGILCSAATLAKFYAQGYELGKEDIAKLPMLHVLEMLANGQVRAKLLQRFFWSNHTLFQKASRLCLKDQDAIADGIPFNVYGFKGGEESGRLLTFDDMNDLEVKQLIDSKTRRIRRSLAEQHAYLRQEQTKADLKAAKKRPEAVVDAKSRKVIIDGNAFSIDELMGWIKQMTR